MVTPYKCLIKQNVIIQSPRKLNVALYPKNTHYSTVWILTWCQFPFHHQRRGSSHLLLESGLVHLLQQLQNHTKAVQTWKCHLLLWWFLIAPLQQRELEHVKCKWPTKFTFIPAHNEHVCAFVWEGTPRSMIYPTHTNIWGLLLKNMPYIQLSVCNLSGNDN